MVLEFPFHLLFDDVFINSSFLLFSAEGTQPVFSLKHAATAFNSTEFQPSKHYMSLSLMSHKEKTIWPDDK